MSVYYATYRVEGGFIHNWLVAGPQATPVDELDRFVGADFKVQIVRHYYQGDSGIDQLLSHLPLLAWVGLRRVGRPLCSRSDLRPDDQRSG